MALMGELAATSLPDPMAILSGQSAHLALPEGWTTVALSLDGSVVIGYDPKRYEVVAVHRGAPLEAEERLRTQGFRATDVATGTVVWWRAASADGHSAAVGSARAVGSGRRSAPSSPPAESTLREVPVVCSVTEAGRMLGVSRAYAYQLVSSGQLPSVRLGRRRVVPRSAVVELLETGA